MDTGVALGKLIQGQDDIRQDLKEIKEASDGLEKRVRALEGWRKYVAGAVAVILVLVGWNWI